MRVLLDANIVLRLGHHESPQHEETKASRVRKSGKNEDRTTGNMVWGEFVHFTSRPIDGVPDPHLHAHCFVFNTTFDKQEDSWKAGQFSSLKRDAPYFEARFHVRLARRLGELGLDFTRTKKGWELTGLDKKTLDKLGWVKEVPPRSGIKPSQLITSPRWPRARPPSSCRRLTRRAT